MSLQPIHSSEEEKDLLRKRSWVYRIVRRAMSRLRFSPEFAAGNATSTDVLMMEKAIAAAREAWDIEEVPVGAVVYHGDEIISTAFNFRESGPDPTGHAEIIALQRAAKALGEWRLNECTLAVTLEPCIMCAGAIVNARIGKLVYGASDAKAGGVESLYELCSDKRLNHQVEIIRGVMAPECRNILREFFKERRKINKQKRESA